MTVRVLEGNYMMMDDMTKRHDFAELDISLAEKKANRESFRERKEMFIQLHRCSVVERCPEDVQSSGRPCQRRTSPSVPKDQR